MAKVRNICFTLNNYTNEDVDNIKNNLGCKYIVLGDEKGDSGTPHLQGYAEFENSRSFKAIKKVMPKAHIEIRRGTSIQASEYCKKEKVLYEFGEISNQGKRSDIERCVDIIKDGGSMKDVALQEPVSYVKYHKGFRALKGELIKPRDFVPDVTVYWGSTGSGKSRKAREGLEDYYVWTPQREKWFDGYEGQENVIFEEFRGQLTLGFMLTLLDRYECPVQYKGGTIEFVGKRIIITSPKHPRDWYQGTGDDKIEQLLRRITRVEKLEQK